MLNKIYKYLILLVCSMILMSCNNNLLHSTKEKSNINSLNITKEDESIIRDYLDNNTGHSIVPSNEETYTAFKILGTNPDEIYLWVLKENKSGSITSLPVLLKAKKEDNTLKIDSFKIPGEGADYGVNIKKMFPKSVQNQIFADVPTHNAMVEELKEELEKIKSSKK